MTHRKGPIDRVNCCHRVLGHRASRLTSHGKGPLLVMNVFHFPSVACGDVTTLYGACASFGKQKLIVQSTTTQHNTTQPHMKFWRERCTVIRVSQWEGWLTATTSSLSSLSRPTQQSQIGTAYSWRKEIGCLLNLFEGVCVTQLPDLLPHICRNSPKVFISLVDLFWIQWPI